MNQNPERPKNMNEIIEGISNPNYKKPLTTKEIYQEQQKKLLKEIFEDD